MMDAGQRNAFWNSRYGEDGFAYGTAPNEFLAATAERIPPGPVLCLGAGEGRNAVYLAEVGGAERTVVAVDAAEVGLAKTRALADERGVEVATVHADLADFSIEQGAWSGIVSIFCHLPPPLRTTVHRAAVAGLRPGGVLLMESYTPEQMRHGSGGPRNPELLYTLDLLEAELGELRLDIARALERELGEGRYHVGTAAVAQILGVREA